MQKFTQKWTLIALFQPLDDGTEFFWKNWPQHITLVDVFSVDWEKNGLFEKLEARLAKEKTIKLIASDNTYFVSSKNTTQVRLFETNKELQLLHEDIVGLLNNAGATFNDPQYVGDGFVPHSEIKENSALDKGAIIKISELTIVDMFPRGDGYQRKLFRTIKFAG